MSLNLIELSKTVSHALRHEPQSYNLALDEQGWVDLSDLVNSLINKGWKDLRQEDIIIMVEKSQKKRHQIFKSKIRAYYGHSTLEKIKKQNEIPPDVLFHGTSLSKLKNILQVGLMPMKRQYVHLSENIETASNVANRRNEEIIVLVIQSLDAYNCGIPFYKEENNIWLSDSIPAKFIKT